MESPFQFGKTVSGSSFTDRSEQIERLTNNFKSGISTVLISPRRWGKSSLVKKCINDRFSGRDNYKIVMIDLFRIRSEEEFFEVYAEELLKTVSTKVDEMMEHTRMFFKKIIPKITISSDSLTDFSLSFDMKELKKNRMEILDLADKVAEKKKISIIFCIDEFQNIALYKNTESIQRELRSCWQNHENVTYCLYGSKRHMMKDIFSTPERPFYRFGDVIFLDKIELQYWQPFIVDAFKSTGKKIMPDQSRRIATTMKNHPYYVQQLSHIVWNLTESEVTEEIIEKAEKHIIEANIPFMMSEYETLNASQINMLKAVCGGETQLNSVDVLQKYRLGTSGNASKNKKILENRDIINISKTGIELLDPVFELWFKGL